MLWFIWKSVFVVEATSHKKSPGNYSKKCFSVFKNRKEKQNTLSNMVRKTQYKIFIYIYLLIFTIKKDLTKKNKILIYLFIYS